MSDKPKTTVDENFFREYLKDSKAVPKQEVVITEEQPTVKKVKTKVAIYWDTFFVKGNVSKRKAVNIDASLHKKIEAIVVAVGRDKITINELISNIIREHLTQNEEVITHIYKNS